MGSEEEYTFRVGVILKGVASPSERSQTLLSQFATMAKSLIRNLESRERISRVRIAILTDKDSTHCVHAMMTKFIKTECRVCALGTDVGFELFDVDSMIDDYRNEILAIRQHFVSSTKMASKWKRIVLLDADLKFINTDVTSLQDNFIQMRKRGQIVGVGLDLSPHYSVALKKYREENPGTEIGSPGRYQGFNTGVVLYDLEAMRSHPGINEMITNHAGKLDTLAEKYSFKSHLGDQCMFTLIGLENPQWFHILSCDWNFQLDVTMATQKEFEKEFDRYHNCTLYPKILHGNGNTPIPLDDDQYFYGQFTPQNVRDYHI